MDFKQSFSHGSFYSLPEVQKQGLGEVSRLPVSLRIVALARTRHRVVTAVSRLSEEERAAHAAFVRGLGAGAIWRDYLDLPESAETPA